MIVQLRIAAIAFPACLFQPIDEQLVQRIQRLRVIQRVTCQAKEEMRIAVLSPHLDDAAFSVSLVICELLSVGHEVQVVNCFTRSSYAPFLNYSKDVEQELQSLVTALRRHEDVNWCKTVGVSRVDLSLEDAPLRLHCSSEQVCKVAVDAEDKAGTEICGYLQSISAEAFIVPLALGAHVDHLTAREAALPLMRRGVPCAFYEDLPYAARKGVAEQIEVMAAQIDLGLRSTFVGSRRDLTATIEKKRELVLMYSSQIDERSAEEIVQFSARYGGRERLWANESWFRSALGIEE